MGEVKHRVLLNEVMHYMQFIFSKNVHVARQVKHDACNVKLMGLIPRECLHTNKMLSLSAPYSNLG